MVKTIFIPMAVKYNHDELLMMRHNNSAYIQRQQQAKETRVRAQSELNDLLTDGYTLLHAGKIETSSSWDFAFVLYKAGE